MRNIIIFLLALVYAGNVAGQSVLPFRGDTIKIQKVGGYAELVIENRTKDTTGFLFNKGGGRTEFRKVRQLNDSTIIFGFDTIKISSNPSAITDRKPYYFASHYGANSANSDNRTNIQATIDAADALNGIAYIDIPGTYLLGTTSSGGVTRCLTMKEGVNLYIGPGVTLKIKNSAITNGAPVQLIHIPATAKNVYIGWPNGKGGTLDGNTSNQSGWTSGYGQSAGNYLIGSPDGVDGITVENLNFTRSFSNSINIGVTNGYGGSKNIVLRNLYAENFGEGIQVISADNVTCENITHVMNGSIVAGDGLELAFCRDFSVKGCRTTTSSGLSISTGGSGIDLYASRNGSCSDFYINGTVYGFQVETDFSNNTRYPDNITITNGTIVATNFSPFIGTGGNISVSNVQMLDCKQNGPQLSKNGIAATYRWENIKLSGKCIFYLNDSLKFSGSNLAMQISQTGAGAFSIASPDLDIDGLQIRADSAIGAFFFAENGVPKGRIINIDADSVFNNARNIVLGTGANLSSLILSGNPPLRILQGLVSPITGSQTAVIVGNVNSSNLPIGSKGQRVTINGQYGATFTNGSRLKLYNNTDATLSSIDDQITLEYGSDDIWREINRSITSSNALQDLQSVTTLGSTTNKRISLIDTSYSNYNGISGFNFFNNLNKSWTVGYGNTGYSQGTNFILKHSSGSFFVIDSAGNVGVNTVPVKSFDIYRNGVDATLRLTAASSNNALIEYYSNGSFRGVEGYTAAGDRFMYHGGSNTYPYYIFPNGRIRFGDGTGIEDGSGYKFQFDGGIHVSDSIYSEKPIFHRGSQKFFGLFPGVENEYVRIGTHSNQAVKIIANDTASIAIHPNGKTYYLTHPAFGAEDSLALIDKKYIDSINNDLTALIGSIAPGGMSEVIHDWSLTGKGTTDDSLRVNVDSFYTKTQVDSIATELELAGGADQWGSQVVEHDATLLNNGTTGSPLKVDTSLTNAWLHARIDSLIAAGTVAPDGSETKVTQGTGVTVTGTGTTPDPYIISAALSGGNQLNALVIDDFGAVYNNTSTGSRNANKTAWENMLSAAGDNQLCIIPGGRAYYFPNSQIVRSSSTKRFNILIMGHCFFQAGGGFTIENDYPTIVITGELNGGNPSATDSTSYAAYSGYGLYLRNCLNPKVWVNRVRFFRAGVVCAGESTTIPRGTQYARVIYSSIRNNYINIWNTTFGTTDGSVAGDRGNWSNSNYYEGGQLGGGNVGTALGGVFGILIKKDASSNQASNSPFNYNTFHNTGFEGLRWGVYAENADFNTFSGGGRLEGPAVTYPFYFRENTSGGWECYRNDLRQVTGIYESYFYAGGRGVGTLMPPMTTSNGLISADISADDGSGNYLNFVMREPSPRTSTWGMFSIGNFGGNRNSRYAIHVIKPTYGVDDYVSFDGKSVTVTTNYTVADNISTVYTNGNLTVTLPAASSFPEREIVIKDISNTSTATIATVGVGNTSSVTGRTGVRVKSNGSGWYSIDQKSGSGTTETASNGLFKTGNDIQLGGNMTATTAIYGNGNDLSLGTSGSNIGQLYLGADNITARGRLRYEVSNLGSASVTIPSTDNTYYLLDNISANRTVTFPTSPFAGDILVITNLNSSGNTWQVSGTVKDRTNATITSFTNGYTYSFIYDGSTWRQM